MDSTHTELPWKISEPLESYHVVNILSINETVATCGIKDAELIVKSVNNHDALVEAAKIAKERLETLMGEPGWVTSPFGSVWKAYQALDEALSKAGE